MSDKVNPILAQKLQKFGKGNWNECFQCGTCTATCQLTEQGFLFPRKGMKAVQLGLQNTMADSIEPWLCYYCGECSDVCPRDANPAETMMTLRRYLTSVYDWTGLARLFYVSHSFEFIAIGVLATLVTALLVIANPNGIVTELTADGGVRINEMFPVEWVHIGDLIMAGLIGGLLITNIMRMWYIIILKDKSIKIPFGAYITGIKDLMVHFATQKKFNKCDDKKTYWGAHLILMTAYILMFTMIVAFLLWFQTEEIFPWYNPQRLLGYYATFGLFLGLIYFIVKRLKKESQSSKYSHLSDWMFIILLFLTTLTGILLHIFRINGMPTATYYMYIIHMAVLVPMLVIEVPFSKWSHLAYRPVAIYFATLKRKALLNKNVKN